MLKKFCFVIALIVCWSNISFAIPIYQAEEGIDFGYRFLDTKRYNSNLITLSGLHTVSPHQFGYKFEHIFGTENLTSLNLSYAYKKDRHWTGLSISSASNKPFTRFNLIDFDIFYAFRIFQETTEYTELQNGLRKAYYTRLYVGIDYSTERILLDGFPLPVIRYEYNLPTLRLIIGFPLTYIKMKTIKLQSLELKYIPVMNLLAGYNFGFDEHNTLSIYFEMENKKYRMSSTRADVYYSNQLKYYTEFMMLKLQYSFNFKDTVSINPYAAFVINGRRYWSKSISNTSHKNSTGLGFAAGINLLINF